MTDRIKKIQENMDVISKKLIEISEFWMETEDSDIKEENNFNDVLTGAYPFPNDFSDFVLMFNEWAVGAKEIK